MPETKRPLKVFLCHASTDKPKVRELYRYLKRRGINPWLDEEHLVGGQDWQVEIPKALATSDAIIICLTKNSVDKEGYIQREIKFALDKALEMPEGRIFLIPVKFEECEVPFSLSRYQWVDLTVESGYSKMMKALKFRASQLERTTVELPKKNVEEENLAIEKVTKERVERGAAEKAAREKSKQEYAAKTRLEAEELPKQKAAKEKLQREEAEKAARQIAIKAAVTNLFFKVKPYLRTFGVVVIVVVLFWTGSWTIPKLFLLIPTPKVTETQRSVVKITLTNSPAATSTKIPLSSTPVKTRISIPTTMPAEISDASGARMVFISAENANSFYIDKYEVINSLYRECVRDKKCDGPTDTMLVTWSYFGNNDYDNYPVVWVKQTMAKEFCEWRDSRLPTGVEWEIAAGGTDGRIYPWGNSLDEIPYANHCDLSISNGSCGYADHQGEWKVNDGYPFTAPVGSFPLDVSPYGVYDMAGNVSEWINDVVGGRHLKKGGSWIDIEDSLKISSFSYDIGQRFSDTHTGIRCARDANP